METHQEQSISVKTRLTGQVRVGLLISIGIARGSHAEHLTLSG